VLQAVLSIGNTCQFPSINSAELTESLTHIVKVALSHCFTLVLGDIFIDLKTSSVID
jgi:hypothetical protein